LENEQFLKNFGKVSYSLFLTYLTRNMNLEKKVMGMNLVCMGTNIVVTISEILTGIISPRNKNSEGRKEKYITGVLT
jgi:multisubunit Na+/H+ antiporter MnhC subunit